MNLRMLKKQSLNLHNSFSFYGKYYLLYTAVFSVMILTILSLHIADGYSLIMNDDSYFQYYKAIRYYSTYIREIFRTLFIEHSFVIPQWDFEIGMGSDIISTFSYYSLGDPINFLSVFVPEKFIHYFCQITLILRYYLAGITFSLLCFKTENNNRIGVLVGALTYIFSAYAVKAGLTHHYFINPMIYLPLIILGIEYILNGKKILLFTISVSFAALSNFYFFYMIVMLTVIYVIVRMIVKYKKDFKMMLKAFIKIAFSSITGVCMAAVLLLPTIIAFFGDSRVSIENSTELFYQPKVYGDIILSFFTYPAASSWLFVCMSIIFLPCITILFIKRRENTHLKILYFISIVFMSFPFFGKFMNGFSYLCHRWCFGYVLLISFIIVKCWNKLIQINKKELKVICITTIISGITALCIGYKHSNYQFVFPFVLLVIVLTVFNILIKNSDKIERKAINRKILQFTCFSLTVLTIFYYNYQHISAGSGNLISKFIKSDELKNDSYASNTAILEATNGDNDFWRYSGRNLGINASLLDNLKSTQFYWSLSNSNISEFRRDMNMAENILYFYEGYDDRTALNALASVKYFYVGNEKKNNSLPYGYEAVSDSVYKNKYPLPLGYTYDEYITLEEYNSLETSIAKQEMLLSAALLEKDYDSILKTKKTATSNELDYKIICLDSGVKTKDNCFMVSKAGAKIELEFESVPNSETYLSISNLGYDEYNNGRITFKIVSSDAVGNEYTKSFFYYTPDANFYSNRKNFDINLGYTESGISKTVVTFPCEGVYSYDSIRIISQPMKNYETKIEKLNEDVLENINLYHNVVSGKITLDKNKLLCLSIPYSNGWKAYVNEEETELLRTNGMYMGLLLDKGEYEIQLQYNTPGLKLGALISIFGILAFSGTIFYYKKRQNTSDF